MKPPKIPKWWLEEYGERPVTVTAWVNPDSEWRREEPRCSHITGQFVEVEPYPEEGNHLPFLVGLALGLLVGLTAVAVMYLTPTVCMGGSILWNL